MNAIRKIVVLIIMSFIFTGCGVLSALFKKNNDNSIEIESAVATHEGGTTKAYVNPNSEKSLEIKSESIGGMENARLEFKPGTLTVGQNISMELGQNLADSKLKEELDLSEDTKFTAGGEPLKVDSDANENLAGPMTITIPLPNPPTQLLLADDQIYSFLVVIYLVHNKVTGETFSGIIPFSFLSLDVSKNELSFESEYFGIFQAVYLNIKIPEAIMKPSTKEVLSKKESGDDGFQPTTEEVSEAESEENDTSNTEEVNASGADTPEEIALVPEAMSVSDLQEDTEKVITFSYNMEQIKATSCEVANTSNAVVTEGCICNSTGICTVKVKGSDHYHGSAGFDYTLQTDNQQSPFAEVELSISSVEDNPVASDLTQSAFPEEGSTTVELSYFDGDGDSATSCSTSNLAGVHILTACTCSEGDCSLVVGGNTDVFGAASFDYTVTTNSTVSNTATVSLTISGVNDAPTISDILATSINEDDTLSNYAVTIGDVDMVLSCSTALSGLSSNQSIVKDANITFNGTYPNCKVNITPEADAYGAVTITATVTDGNLVANDDFNLNVNGVNDAPTAVADSYSVAEDGFLSKLAVQGVLANDTDLEANPLSNATVQSGVSNGSLTLNGDGSFDYTPDPDFNGSDSFTYSMKDNASATSNTTTVNITVTAVNDFPVFTNGVSDMIFQTGTSLSGNTVLAVDPDGTTIAYGLDTGNMNCDDQGWSTQIGINTSSGELSGIASVPGPCSVRVSASSNGDTVYHTFEINALGPSYNPCASGTLSTICTVNTGHLLPDGDAIYGTGDLIIESGGQISTTPMDSIIISMGGDITIESGGSINANLTLLKGNDISIDAGSFISADLLGHAGGSRYDQDGLGPGKGSMGWETGVYKYAGGGGGYGGGGGHGEGGFPSPTAGNKRLGGPTYGDNQSPTDFGSGGGGANSTAAGGPGGGKVKIEAQGILTINGNITANGGDGADSTTCCDGDDGAGGGSGGSVWVIGDTITGSANIHAKGGKGGDDTYGSGSRFHGGGGGGGRISIEASTAYTFSGSTSAIGGSKGDNGSVGDQCNFCTNGFTGTIYTNTP